VSTKSVMGTTATGRPRNRSWPEALKREIVAASFAPGSSVSIVARQYDVNANQVFNWRKRYSDDPRGSAGTSLPRVISILSPPTSFMHLMGSRLGTWALA
jgi:transposase-like protein